MEATEVRRWPEETCGTHGLGPQDVTEIRLRVERVLSGVAEGHELTVLADGHGLFPNGSAADTRILAWGVRSCDDNWRLYCRVAIVEADGRVVPTGKALMKGPDGKPIESASLTELEGAAAKFAAQPTNLYEGATAVALARRGSSSGWTATGAVLQLDSLGWVAGTGTRVPRYLSFPSLPGCYPDIYSGDSLLVPVPAAFQGDTLVLDKCPSALRLKNGFAPGLGVRIDDAQLADALFWVNQTLHVRRVRGEDR